MKSNSRLLSSANNSSNTDIELPKLDHNEADREKIKAYLQALTDKLIQKSKNIKHSKIDELSADIEAELTLTGSNIFALSDTYITAIQINLYYQTGIIPRDFFNESFNSFLENNTEELQNNLPDSFTNNIEQAKNLNAALMLKADELILNSMHSKLEELQEKKVISKDYTEELTFSIREDNNIMDNLALLAAEIIRRYPNKDDHKLKCMELGSLIADKLAKNEELSFTELFKELFSDNNYQFNNSKLQQVAEVAQKFINQQDQHEDISKIKYLENIPIPRNSYLVQVENLASELAKFSLVNTLPETKHKSNEMQLKELHDLNYLNLQTLITKIHDLSSTISTYLKSNPKMAGQLNEPLNNLVDQAYEKQINYLMNLASGYSTTALSKKTKRCILALVKSDKYSGINSGSENSEVLIKDAIFNRASLLIAQIEALKRQSSALIENAYKNEDFKTHYKEYIIKYNALKNSLGSNSNSLLLFDNMLSKNHQILNEINASMLITAHLDKNKPPQPIKTGSNNDLNALEELRDKITPLLNATKLGDSANIEEARQTLALQKTYFTYLKDFNELRDRPNYTTEFRKNLILLENELARLPSKFNDAKEQLVNSFSIIISNHQKQLQEIETSMRSFDFSSASIIEAEALLTKHRELVQTARKDSQLYEDIKSEHPDLIEDKSRFSIELVADADIENQFKKAIQNAAKKSLLTLATDFFTQGINLIKGIPLDTLLLSKESKPAEVIKPLLEPLRIAYDNINRELSNHKDHLSEDFSNYIKKIITENLKKVEETLSENISNKIAAIPNPDKPPDLPAPSGPSGSPVPPHSPNSPELPGPPAPPDLPDLPDLPNPPAPPGPPAPPILPKTNPLGTDKSDEPIPQKPLPIVNPKLQAFYKDTFALSPDTNKNKRNCHVLSGCTTATTLEEIRQSENLPNHTVQTLHSDDPSKKEHPFVCLVTDKSAEAYTDLDKEMQGFTAFFHFIRADGDNDSPLCFAGLWDEKVMQTVVDLCLATGRAFRLGDANNDLSFRKADGEVVIIPRNREAQQGIPEELSSLNKTGEFQWLSTRIEDQALILNKGDQPAVEEKRNSYDREMKILGGKLMGHDQYKEDFTRIIIPPNPPSKSESSSKSSSTSVELARSIIPLSSKKRTNIQKNKEQSIGSIGTNGTPNQTDPPSNQNKNHMSK